jgi:hypothetical protein
MTEGTMWLKSAMLGALAVCGLLSIAGCGGSGTTTVIKEAAPTTVEKTTTVQAPTPQPKPASTPPTPAPPPASAPQPKSPPNVVGLPLPAAQQALRAAGFRAAVKNTDTALGILVPSHYTICTEGAPRGNLVPVLAQKYGC